MSTPTAPPLVFPSEIRKLRLVLSEPVPAALFVCSAKIRSEASQLLCAHFQSATELPTDVDAIYRRHLAYACDLGEKYYEAGPAADFSEILYIYRAQSLPEAMALFENDPLYREGLASDPWYFEWHIHSPIYKSALPPMPEQTVEFKVHEVTPQTLVVGIGDFNMNVAMGAGEAPGHMPIFHLMHVANRHAEGGLGSMGIDWGIGPAGPDKTLHILNVPGVEQAKLFNEMDAACRWGVMSNFRYFEWCIHYPVRKASPRHKRALLSALGRAGLSAA